MSIKLEGAMLAIGVVANDLAKRAESKDELLSRLKKYALELADILGLEDDIVSDAVRIGEAAWKEYRKGSA